MKRVEVLIPFHMNATNTFHVPGDVIEVSEDTLAKIREVHPNMVLVVADVEEPVQDEKPEQPKKRKTKKQ
jgi:hypothetical protein